MVITNGKVFGEDCLFAMADIEYEDGRIVRMAPVGSLASFDAIDAAGGFVLPGFVDIHTHGCMGSDLMDGDPAGLEKMLDYYGCNGITSVVPAAVTSDEQTLEKAVTAALPYFDKEGCGAVLRGVNLEGPHLNPAMAGAQNPAALSAPDIGLFERVYTLAEGNICLVDIAPELPGSIDYIRRACRRCTVSLAHTDADYDTAAAAFEAGASHVTHLFNAMLPFMHRAPGVVGAASDKAAHVELIADGIHLHPSVVRAVFKWFGAERVCLVSDSIRGTGLPDGEYSLGGLAVQMQDGKATLADTDTLAGSAVNLAECCRRAIRFGVPMEHVIRAATLNPARAAGLEREVGSLMPGKRADILVWTRDLQPAEVIVGGKRLLD